MRITRSSLLSLARDMASLRFQQERDLVCIYLTGSMRMENPLLGGTTDIDMVFVHAKDPPVGREIQKISAEVSLDISHLSQSVFEQPRRLRLDPWLGSFLCADPVILQEHQHWFEFTQAAVCSRFAAPEVVLERARPLAGSARRAWFALQEMEGLPSAGDVLAYLKAVEQAVDALAVLYGPPLTERRFLLDFSTLSEKIGQPAFSTMANSLVSPQSLPEGFWQEWMPAWREVFAHSSQKSTWPEKLAPAREAYYIKACDVLQEQSPAAALWILLRTYCLAENVRPHKDSWDVFCSATAFDPAAFSERLESLDHFLDEADEWIEKWAAFNGL
jgi:hypothetical protein